ncbi:MAG: riboflavin kinase [Planctomycetota bacterium]|nr:riboflavin kinase [Planctomycetota bacterium]
MNCCGAQGETLTGIVVKGHQYPHKAPTANVAHGGTLSPGIYRGCAYTLGDESDECDKYLGKCLVWVVPNQTCAEAYIADFSGDLYGELLKLRALQPVTRDEMIEGYDRFLLGGA